MQRTDEQTTIRTSVQTAKDNLLIDARAGSGKTTSVLDALEVIPAPSTLLCAFNKRIQVEMEQRLPLIPKGRVVVVKTLHAVGLKVLRDHFPHLSLPERDAGNDATEELINDAWGELARGMGGGSFTMNMRRCAVRLLRTVKDIQAAPDLDGKTIREIGIEYQSLGDFATHEMDTITQVVGVAYKASQNFRARKYIDYPDMVWGPVVLGLKPKSRYKAVIVDEAQDVADPQLALIEMLLAPDGRLILVGDPHQCHPAGTVVTTTDGDVAIEELDPARHKIVPWQRKAQRSTGSRAFTLGKRPYNGRLSRVQIDGREVEATPNHKFLCRWARRDLYCVYLMYREDRGFRVGWCQTHSKTNGGKAFHLAQRARLERADSVWILKCFDTKQEASIYESVVAARYGLFTATFEPIHNNSLYTSEALKAMFDGLTSEQHHERAKKCLDAHNRCFEQPMWPYPGANLRDHQGRPTYFLCHTSNLIPGVMALPLESGTNSWGVVSSITHRSFSGLVYSLDVEVDHLYSANGIVVHNSIYGWRGAQGAKVWKTMIEKYKAKRLGLTITWRCPKAVVRLASQLVPDFKARPGAPEGSVTTVMFDKAVVEMSARFAGTTFVLARANAPLLRVALELWKRGVRFTLNGGKEIIYPLLRIVDKLDHSSTDAFKRSAERWYKLEQDRAEKAESTALAERAEQMFGMAMCAIEYASGPSRVVGLLRDVLGTEHKSNITLSTVHKVKGLEADRVFLIKETFQRHRKPDPKWGDWRPRVDPEELNIEYVAITRAKESLTWIEFPEDALSIIVRNRLREAIEDAAFKALDQCPDGEEKDLLVAQHYFGDDVTRGFDGSINIPARQIGVDGIEPQGQPDFEEFECDIDPSAPIDGGEHDDDGIPF